jgi:hypothetical protein
LPAIGPVHSPQGWQASIHLVGHVSNLLPLSRASLLPQAASPSCRCLLGVITGGSWLASDRASSFTSRLAGQHSPCWPCIESTTAIAGKPPQAASPSCRCLLGVSTGGSWLASDRASSFNSRLAGQYSPCWPCIESTTVIAGKPAPTGSVAIVPMPAWSEYRWELACQ